MAKPQTIKDTQGRTYTLGPPLGTGSQATVYAAQASQGQAVAVKLFKNSPTLAAELQRAEALMRHVQSLGVSLPATFPLAMVKDGQHQGYVTELVHPSQVLEDVIDAGQIGYFAGFEIVCAVWEALAQLHAAGIVHGDIQAKNILLSPQGLALIDVDNFTLPGSVGLPPPPLIGDLHVMAPELRRCMMAKQSGSHLISPACDVYAANALTYLMLVGDDDNMGAVGADALHQAKLSGQWNGDPFGAGKSINLNPRMLPARLMSLVRQAWHGEPSMRPAALEFAQALQEIRREGRLFVCPHCGQAVFAESAQQHCPHCQQALPMPTLVGPGGVRLVVSGPALPGGRQELGGDAASSSRHAVLQRVGPLLRFTERSTYGASQRLRVQPGAQTAWEPIAPSEVVVLQPGEKLRLGNTVFEVTHT